jgi:AcrR family transcriptional regulator
MATPPRSVDPRVKRTRQLLQQAFFEIMEEKGFAAMTVQDITERATVNRGTFYAHFTDKYALLDAIIREQFQEVLASKLAPGSKWEKQTLRLLILAVLDFFKQVHGHCGPNDAINPLIERAAQEELTKALLALLKQSQGRDGSRPRWPAPVEVTAAIVSWAIFGAAAEWSQQERPIPAEHMANHILAVVTEGVAPLDPALS